MFLVSLMLTLIWGVDNQSNMILSSCNFETIQQLHINESRVHQMQIVEDSVGLVYFRFTWKLKSTLILGSISEMLKD